MLTKPEWQPLAVHFNQKSTARLSVGDSLAINLAYFVQNRVSHIKSAPASRQNFKIIDSNDKAVTTSAVGQPRAEAYRTFWTTEKSWFRWNGRMRNTLTPMSTQRLPDRPATTATAVTANMPPASPPALMPEALIRQMGDDINQIRDFLLALALRQRIPPTSFDVPNFKKSVLSIGNRYRRHHNAIDLVYDGGCEAAAKRWADSLADRRSCLSHEPYRRYGENMFFFASPHYFTDPTTLAEATMHSFYMEQRLYNYGSFSTHGFFRYGHFTQMLWRSSRLVGVGVTIGEYGPQRSGPCMPHRGSGHFIFVVLKYDPPGNVQTPSEYFANVQPYR